LETSIVNQQLGDIFSGTRRLTEVYIDDILSDYHDEEITVSVGFGASVV
jgi:hypothetical protein